MKHAIKTMLVAIIATAFPLSVWSAADVALGKIEYMAKCAVCHGDTGKGDGPYNSQLAARASDLTVLSKNNEGVFPDVRILMMLDGRSEVQGHGPRHMPVYGEVYLAEGPKGKTAKEKESYVDTRLHALMTYLKSIQGMSADDKDLGRSEYMTKCAVCHGDTGKGDGPYNSQLAARASDLTVLTKNNKGVFPDVQILMMLDGRSEIQGHGPRHMPVYGEVYLAEGSRGKTAAEKESYVDARLNALIEYLMMIQQ